MRQRNVFGAVLLACLTAACSARLALAAPKPESDFSLAELLPASTVVYVEIAQPKELLATLWQHPLRAKLEASEPYRQAVASPQFAVFQLGLKFVELQLGSDWRSAVESVTANGLAVGVDLPTKGIVLLAKSDDETRLAKIRDKLVEMARTDAKNKHSPDPYSTSEYRGVTIYETKAGGFVTRGKWLIVSNQESLFKGAIDRLLGGDGETLAGNAHFQAARKMPDQHPAVWSFVQVGAIRELARQQNNWNLKADNVLAELLFGGIITAADKTPYATASLFFDRGDIRLAIAAANDPQTAGKPEFFFGSEGKTTAAIGSLPKGSLPKGSLPKGSLPSDALAAVSMYRDVGKMWSGAADLLDQKLQEQIAAIDSGISTFFMGKDFGRDILSGLKPEWQLFAARQTFAADAPRPDLKLPSLALMARLKEPAKSQPSLKVAFQNIVSVINIEGAKTGQPQFEMNSETIGKARAVSAKYVLDDEERTKKAGLVNFNFSPTLAFIDDRVILASTRQIALDLLRNCDAEQAATAAEKLSTDTAGNTLVHLNPQLLAEVLRDNRQRMISNNMLEKGHDKAQAEKEIDGVLMVLGWFGDATLRLANDPAALRLDLTLQTAK